MYLNQIVECGGIPYPEYLCEPDFMDTEEIRMNELIALKLNELLDKPESQLNQVEQEIIESYFDIFSNDDSYKLKIREMINEEIPEDAQRDHREVGFDQVDWVEF